MAWLAITGCTAQSPNASTSSAAFDSTWSAGSSPNLVAVIDELNESLNSIGLENSEPTAVVAYGECTDGQVHVSRILIRSIQKRYWIIHQQLIVIEASIHSNGEAQISWLDETEYYPATDPLILSDMPFEDALPLVSSGLVEYQQCDQVITLAKVTDNEWTIRCGPPDVVFITCFELDSTTGRLIATH